MSPIPVGFRYFLHEIGPMTRNPERDTERSRVVRARSPALPEGANIDDPEILEKAVMKKIGQMKAGWKPDHFSSELQKLRRRGKNDERIEKGRPNLHGAEVKVAAQLRISLKWLNEETDETVTVRLNVPKPAAQNNGDDKRYLFFQENGIELRDDNGNVFKSARNVHAITWPLPQLLSRKDAEQIIRIMRGHGITVPTTPTTTTPTNNSTEQSADTVRTTINSNDQSPPTEQNMAFLFNKFINEYSPGRGTLFVGPGDAFTEFTSCNFYILFSQFLDRDENGSTIHAEEWRRILSLTPCQAIRTIARKLRFCRDLLREPERKKVRYEGTKYAGSLYTFEGRRSGW
jgi:hypothetical protein